jgi:hypothetical protein
MATFADLFAQRPDSRDAFAQQLMQALRVNDIQMAPPTEEDIRLAGEGSVASPTYSSAALDAFFGGAGSFVGPGWSKPGYYFTGPTMYDPYQTNNHVGRWTGNIGADGSVSGLRWINDSTNTTFLDRVGQALPYIGGALALGGAAGFGPLGGFSGATPGAAAGAAGGVSAGEIAGAAGMPELGLAAQTGGAGWAAPITASQVSSLGPAATWGDKLTYLTQGLGGAAAGAAGGAGGSNWLTSALRLAPLAGLALGGKPSIPNPPATDPQANIDAGVKSINDLFANDKRAPIYKQIYDDSYGLQSSRLDENRQDTLRKLRFGLARGGLTGGSADVSAHGLEQREFGRALSDASTAAQGQADQVRANDEKTRLNLIAQMRAGLDSADAMQSALTQMADNANAARAQTRYDALDSYMGAVAPTINNFQVRSGQQAAQQLYNTRFPQNRISLSGRSGTIVG